MRALAKVRSVMRADLQRHITVLNELIEDLDRELFNNPDWKVRQSARSESDEDALSTERIYEQLRLENALARDPIYRARVRATEIIQILSSARAAVMPKDAMPASASSAAPKTHVAIDRQSKQSESLRGTAVSSAPTAVSMQEDEVDDLTRIRGINLSLSERLKERGVTRYQQISNWTREDIAKTAKALDLGRAISQQNWIEQAAMLAAQKQQRASSSQVERQKPAAMAQPPATRPMTDFTAAMSQASQTHAAASHAVSPVVTELVSAAAANLLSDAEKSKIKAASIPEEAQCSEAQRENSQSGVVPFVPQVIDDPRRANNAGPRPVTPSAPPARTLEARAGTTSKEGDSGQDGTGDVVSDTANDNADKPCDEARPQSDASVQAREQESRSARLRRLRVEQRHKKSPLRKDAVSTPEQDIAPDRLPVAATQPPTPPPLKNPFAPVQSVSSDVTHSHAGQEAHGLSMIDAPTPPPVPDAARRFALRRRKRAGGRAGVGAAPPPIQDQFGDGARWRDPDAAVPGSSADLEGDSKIYSYHEEASVEIVRPPLPDAVDTLARPQVTSRPGQDVQSSIETVGKSGNPARWVANRVRNALRRD